MNSQFSYPFRVPKRSKNFLGAHLSDTFFLAHYTSYYVKKKLSNRKPVGDINFCCISFFLWKFNMGRMDEK